ncbi:hypothetical protein CJP74_03735 [Psittacicella melopsittaci]|uniref:Met repressor n=1 Tax=Psittacicella melopsittaci TaxID=2028576 RepID=A0A3A1Y616_9GAMM|nr:hypothetical protein CJP74_03735 [Psittacicella melopsittaci]
MTKHINPYIEHGQKTLNIKKMTVSVPIEIYETIQSERKRRIDNKMRHATASELLCEAFAHAFTGQPLPTDEELFRYVSKAKAEKYELLRKKNRDDNINSAMMVAESYVGVPEFREHLLNILKHEMSSNEKMIHIYRLVNLLLTYVISDTMSPYLLRKESQNYVESIEKANKYKDFLDFIDYNVQSANLYANSAREVQKVLHQLAERKNK